MGKLVRESLGFERTGNVKSSLGIGREAVIRKFFRDLFIEDYAYEIKPDGEIFFEYGLYLGSNVNVYELPDNLTINEYLDVSYSNITKLPNNLTIHGDLDIHHTKITELPDDLIVERIIQVDTSQKELLDFIENSKFEDKLSIW